jgi:hypothetical protein
MAAGMAVRMAIDLGLHLVCLWGIRRLALPAHQFRFDLIEI